MKKSTLIALSTSTLLALSACSSGSSDTPASSTTDSPRVETTGQDTSASPSTSSSSSSSNTENPLLALVTPKPDAKRAWAGLGTPRGAAHDVVLAVQEGSAGNGPTPTALAGVNAASRATVWTLDLTKPPVALTTPEASVQQVGDAVAITWVGKSGVSELDAGKDMTVSALYDIATGKQRGKTMSAKERPLSNEKNPFLIKLADGFYFADATKADPKSVYLSEYNGSPWLPQPASDTTSSAYDITSKLSVVDDPPAWSMSSDKPANSAQLWDRTTKTKLAETACKGTDLSNPVVSPSGRYAVFGSAAFDLNEHKIWCVKAPADGATIKLISDTGTIYGESNERAYTQAWGQDKPTVLPEGATMPSYVLDSATVYTVTEPSAGAGTVAVRTK